MHNNTVTASTKVIIEQFKHFACDNPFLLPFVLWLYYI